MADAACGPSNALQNFQKHTSVDRTLQQDRLVGRHSPSQGFRSAGTLNNGALDSEFEAFQAGHVGPPQAAFQQPLHHQHAPPHFAPPPLQAHAQFPQGPDWASDFQRLNISHTPSTQTQQHRAPPLAAASSWHQDFLGQQQGSVPQQQSTYGGLSGYGMSGFARPAFQPSMYGTNSVSEIAQGKQPAQEAVPQFDEAAFERAFADVQQEEENLAAESLRQEVLSNEAMTAEQTLTPEQVAQHNLQQQRPAVYAALNLRIAVEENQSMTAAATLNTLETMEQNGDITKDASEAKWVLDTLHKIADREAPQDVKARSEQLIRAINERLMSTYPLLSLLNPINQDSIWDDLQAAGVARSPAPEQMMRQTEAEQQPMQEEAQQQQPLMHDDDEMAETAGRLLERVADNTSEKFQNSQFLELMRRLRDREVRVEGDKMVDVTAASSPAPQPIVPRAQSQPQASHPPQTSVPEIDPNILNHAATDFAMPVFSGDDQQYDNITPLAATSTPNPRSSAERIPFHEQDLDIGRNGMQGLSRNGLTPPVEEFIHFRMP